MAASIHPKVNAGINHASVYCKDLERSIHFYHEVLGLPIIRQLPMPDDPKKPRVVWLPGVELTRHTDDGAVERGSPGFFRHIGLAVDNIEEVCAHLEAEGVAFETPLRDVTFPEIGQGLKLCFFRDPDGILLELVKWRNL